MADSPRKPRLGPTRRGKGAQNPTPEVGTFAMLGRTGLLNLGGRIFDEWDLHLQGFRGRRAYREMGDQDATVGAILFALEMLIRQTHWDFTAADESPEAEENAVFANNALNDMEESWPDTLAEILTCLVYGWSYHEILYKKRGGASDDPLLNSQYDDGKIGWRSWAIRAQESLDRWEFAEDGTLLGLWQIPPPDYRIRYIPYEKALLFRPSVRRGNPEGHSLLRSAYKAYYYKKSIEAIEAIGAERNLVGFPVMRVPPNIVNPVTAADQLASDAYFQALTNLRRDEQEGIMLSSETDEHGKFKFDLTLLGQGMGSAGSAVSTDTIITRYATDIAQSILADFLQLGHSSRGSQALGQSKIDLFNTALAALLDSLCAVVNNRGVPKLLRMNGITDKFPTLGHGEVSRTDLQALGTFVFNLAQAGAQLDLTPGSPLLSYLLEEANLPATASTADASTASPDVDEQSPLNVGDDSSSSQDSPAQIQDTQQQVLDQTSKAPNRVAPDAGQRPEPGNPNGVTRLPPARPKPNERTVQRPQPL